MSKFPFLNLSLRALLTITTFVSYNAQAQLQCVDVFQNDQSKNSTTSPSLEWVKQQRSKAVAYIRKTSQFKAIENLVRELNDVERNISVLDADKFTVKIVDQGLGSRKAVQIVLEDKASGKKEVLLSSIKLKELFSSRKEKEEVPDQPVISKYKNNNTVIPVEIQLSPTKKFLIVKMAAKGSIDVFTVVVIDIETRKIISEIEDVGTSKIVWRSPTEFFHENRGVPPKSFYSKITPDKKIETIRVKNANESNSADQQWIYKRISSTKYRIGSTVKPFEIDFDLQPSIEQILKTTKNPETLWILTKGKNGFKELVKIEIDQNEFVLKRVIDESNMVIDEVIVNSDHLVVHKYLGPTRTVEIADHSGNLISKIDAPSCCDVGPVEYNSQTRQATVVLTSPVKKGIKWTYDLKSKTWLTVEKDAPPKKSNPEVAMMETSHGQFVTEYKTYRSKDGSQIPIRVTYKKGQSFNSEAPVLMEGYGGFASNNYFHPSFEPMTYEFLKAGGVHLAPAIRGSYYYGKTYHDQGRAENKQNVIDDFIGAAEWAIQNKITQPKRIVITGDSHGGLVTGAAVIQRPDLFGLAIPKYGPLAFHDKPNLDPLTTPYQISEYGDLINDPKAQALARQISPQLNIRAREYPMIVVITGRNDSRVNPEHSYQFVKTLQENQKGDQRIDLYTNSNAGHWMGSLFRQDFIGLRTTTDFWSVVFDFLKLELQPQNKTKTNL